MKKITILLCLFISILSARVTWFGYYEFEGDYAKTPTNDIYFDYNKFRLDFDTNPAKTIHIGGDMIYKMYGGKTTMEIDNFLHSSFYKQYPAAKVKTMAFTFNDSLMIDNLFLDFHHQYFELTLGRQQLPTGVGYAWNPTDIFNKKDIMDPTYENPGVDAVQINVPVGTMLTLRGIVQADQSWSLSNQYLEAKTWLPIADLSLVYAKTTHFNQPKDVYGINIEGGLMGVGFRTEFTANRINYINDDLNYEYIVGADYTFNNSLYLLGEYLHNDFGAKVAETDLMHYLAYFNWQQKSLNQNYFFLMAMYPITDLINGTLSTITNLDDESIVVNPQLVYRIYQNVELTLMGNIFIGDNRDEFGYQNAGARVRLRAYF